MEARAPSDLRVLLGGLRVQPQRNARRVPFVSKTIPWHSRSPSDRSVNHDETACIEGRNIAASDLVSGTGGRPRCDHCARIQRVEALSRERESGK